MLHSAVLQFRHPPGSYKAFYGESRSEDLASDHLTSTARVSEFGSIIRVLRLSAIAWPRQNRVKPPRKPIFEKMGVTLGRRLRNVRLRGTTCHGILGGDTLVIWGLEKTTLPAIPTNSATGLVDRRKPWRLRTPQKDCSSLLLLSVDWRMSFGYWAPSSPC